MGKQISIIYVNYFSENLIAQSIESVLNFENRDELEFIIVNNGGSLDGIINAFQFVICVNANENKGFGYANNLGIKYATGEFILFLNPDTLFIEPTLQKCLTSFKSDQLTGAVACCLLNKDLSFQFTYHDGNEVFKKLWLRNPFVIKFLNGSTKALKSIGKIKEKHVYNHHPEWISGAFFLMKKSMVLNYQLNWDEDFFMYWEDVELSRRILKKRLHLYYLSEPSIIHIGGSGEDINLKRFKMMEDGRLLFIRKEYGVILYHLYVRLFRLELKLEKKLARRKDPELKNQPVYFINELQYYVI